MIMHLWIKSDFWVTRGCIVVWEAVCIAQVYFFVLRNCIAQLLKTIEIYKHM